MILIFELIQVRICVYLLSGWLVFWDFISAKDTKLRRDIIDVQNECAALHNQYCPKWIPKVRTYKEKRP